MLGDLQREEKKYTNEDNSNKNTIREWYKLFRDGLNKKSIRFKLLLLVVCTVFATSFAIGSLGCVFSQKIIKTTASQNIKFTTIGYTNQLMGRINRTEKTCNGVVSLLYMNLPSDPNKLLNDQAEMDDYIKRMKSTALAVANDQEEDVIIFFRLNPQYYKNTDGFYLEKRLGDTKFKALPMTNFSQYDITDPQVEWFYKPLAAGKSMWVQSNRTRNTSRRTLTYVEPLIKNNYPIGVVGMEVELDSVSEMVEKIHICEGSVAFLQTVDNTILCRSRAPGDNEKIQKEIDATIEELSSKIKDKNISEPILVKSNGVKYLVYAQTLKSGMKLVVAAPFSKMFIQLIWMPICIFVISIVIGIIVVVIANSVISRMVKPIVELKEHAELISNGDYTAKLEIDAEDEIGALAKAFKKMSNELNKYFVHMQRMAYRDGMTGLKNRSSYVEYAKDCDEVLKHTEEKFAFIYLDVNNLKFVNDTYGHEVGDEMLIGVSAIIMTVFGDDNTFRIGGDEFVAILRDWDAERVERYIHRFRLEIATLNSQKHGYGEIAVAVGYATAVAGDTMEDLLKRADDEMYADKKAIKGIQD